MLTLASLPGLGLELERVALIMRACLEDGSAYLGGFADALAPGLGKMARPALACLAGRFGGEAGREPVLRAAAAIELLHLGTLIHDDVIDGARLRRGRPNPLALYGARQAVLLGDYVMASAIGLMHASASPASVRAMARASARICEGELRQGLERFRTGPRARDYLRRIHAKTAALFSLSARVGGIEGGCQPALVGALAGIGHALGMAFQIVDDILDYTGDSSQLGKPVGSDLMEGVYTLPLIAALEGGSPGLKRALSKAAARGALADRDRRRLVGMVLESGGVEAARTVARIYARRAEERIGRLPSCTAREGLLELTSILVGRDA